MRKSNVLKSLVLFFLLSFSMCSISIVFADTEVPLDDGYSSTGESELIEISIYKEKLYDAYFKEKNLGNYEKADKLLHEIKTFSNENYLTKTNITDSYEFEKMNKIPPISRAMYHILNVEQCPQKNGFYCGYASIQSLLKYYGVSKTQSEIADQVYSKISPCPWYLINGYKIEDFPVAMYLSKNTRHSYHPYPYDTAGATDIKYEYLWSKIVGSIDAKFPIMALGRSTRINKLHYGYPDTTINHWIVVKGYSIDGKHIKVVDPAKSSCISWSTRIEKEYIITMDTFMKYISQRGIIY